MNSSERHPDGALLDQLRAGLLDDKPSQKTALEQHLRQCETCRNAYHWPAALGAAIPQPDEQQLDRLRRQAQAATGPVRRRPRLAPVAAAAVLAIAAVGLFRLLPPTAPDPAQVAAHSQNVPDVYEDLDFYLWLADHKGSGDSST
jgi:ferric-dicitrate binding protein FerR (iron transport regulator)